MVFTSFSSAADTNGREHAVFALIRSGRELPTCIPLLHLVFVVLLLLLLDVG
jgi:hypothetical protein